MTGTLQDPLTEALVSATEGFPDRLWACWIPGKGYHAVSAPLTEDWLFVSIVRPEENPVFGHLIESRSITVGDALEIARAENCRGVAVYVNEAPKNPWPLVMLRV